MRKNFWPFCVLLTATSLGAADLRQATFTQVIKDVTVVSTGAKATAKAKLNDMFINPDIVQTGPDSLAELVADDKTVTRIGANTVFAFSVKGREVNLEQGSVLFHSPKGKGGGTIKTKAASASVLGTTIVVTATASGGFKAIVLEGRGQITLPNGDFRVLTAGQVTFVLPGSQRFGPTLNINLSKLVESSRLVQGFEQELPSMPSILASVERQLTQLVNNILVTTDRGLVDERVIVEQFAEKIAKVIILRDPTSNEEAVAPLIDPFKTALGQDVPIQSLNLGDHPAQLFPDPVLREIPALGVLNFSGLIGNNVTITASAIDFTPFLNQTDFTIAALGLLDIQSPALQLSATRTVGGPSALQKVTLFGKTGLTIASGASITASHIGDLHLVTDGEMRLNNVSFANSGGQLHLTAGQNLNLTSVAISSITTLDVKAVQNLSIASGSFTGVSSSPSIAANLSAGDTLTVNGTAISSVANISLSARTVNLSNINFPGGSAVNLYSQVGQLAANPNTGAASVPGHVNFILNVNYNGNPAQLFVGSTINIGVRP